MCSEEQRKEGKVQIRITKKQKIVRVIDEIYFGTVKTSLKKDKETD